MKLKLTRMRKKAGRLKRRLLQWFEKSLARKAPGLLLELFPPSAVIIEPTNICNLSCPLCPTSQSRRNKGQMPLEALRKIAAELPPSIRTCQLYLSGEPLLHLNGIEVYGNVLERSFHDVWRGTNHISTVQRMLPRNMTLCKTCGLTSGDENRHFQIVGKKGR